MERSTIFHGKIHYQWPFSIAMLNYQRVLPLSYYGDGFCEVLCLAKSWDFHSTYDIFGAIENWKNMEKLHSKAAEFWRRQFLDKDKFVQVGWCVQQGPVLSATLVTCAICMCSFHPVLLAVIVFHPVGWPHLVYPAKHGRPKMKLPPHMYPAARSDIGIQDICLFFSNYHFPYKFCPKNRVPWVFHPFPRFPVSPFPHPFWGHKIWAAPSRRCIPADDACVPPHFGWWSMPGR